MSLLAPLALLGLFGLALPIIAHLRGREPPRVLRFAGRRFLPVVEPVVTHRRSVRDRALLLVRLLALALVVLALARPTTSTPTGFAVIAEPHDAIILLDGSRSMGLRVDEATLLEHAGRRAEELLSSLPAGTRVGLVGSDPGAPRLAPSEDLDRVRLAIEDWIARGGPQPGMPRPIARPLVDVLPEAIAALPGATDHTAEDRPQVVYAIGDATATGLGSLPATGRGGVIVLPLPALPPERPRPAHVSIESVTWTPAPDLDPRAVQIQAAVMLHSAVPAPAVASERAVALVLRRGDTGDEIVRATAELTPDVAAAVELTHTLLEDEDHVPVTLELLDLHDDPLPSDDARHLWLTSRDAAQVVVVNGDPSELRAHDEVFFLSTALGAADEGQNLRVTSLAPDQLAAQLREQGERALAGVHVLVLANVRAPDEDIAPIIVEHVRRGMGLLVTAGDRVEPEVYQARLGAILPLPLREAVVVGTAPGRTEARVEGLAPADLSHPAFRGLQGDLGLSGTRVRRILLLEPDPLRAVQVALSYTNGAPALVTRDADGGRVGVLTTSIDRDWTDLPLRPGFVPLVANVLRWLADRRAGTTAAQQLVGEPRVLRADGPVTVAIPGGRTVSVAPDADGRATFVDTFVPGHYRVTGEGAVTVFAVEVDASESDTTPVEVATPQADESAREVVVSVPRWRPLLWIAMLLIAIESILRFGRRRP